MVKYQGLDCIVLIDDDAATNFLHQNTIMTTGVETQIQVCESGQEALDFLTCSGLHQNATETPQSGIIFLDINMPGMNGWEFLEKYEQLPQERKQNLIVAMLTSSQNPDDLNKSKTRSSVKTFLNKPLREEKMQQLIQENFSLVQTSYEERSIIIND